jgi:hypothetical protein
MAQKAPKKASEKMQQIARRESRPASAPSFQGGFHPILQLQRTIGNRAVARLLQAKFAMSHPGDPYEREADRVAEQVTSMSVTESAATAQRQMIPDEEKDKQPLQTKPLAASITPLAQRQAMPEEEQKEEQPGQMQSTLQRVAGEESVDAGPSIEQQLGQSSGQGSPLPESVRSYMEPRFGADFSGVRVHTGSDSTQLNRSLSAQAFTVGQDIYYGASKSPTDLRLTAHELTHVVQQTGGGTMWRKLARGEPDICLRQGEENPSSRAGQAVRAYELTHVVQQDGEQLQRARTQAKEGAATSGAPSGREKGPLNFLSTDSHAPHVDGSSPGTSVSPIQRHAEHGEPGGAAGVDQVVRDSGSALDPALRDSFGRQFGFDFSAVRVHTDAEAAASAGRFSAHAYTVGSNIVFAPGRFTPYTTAGRRLLAHELAHVVQQGSGAVPAGASRVSKPSDAPEVEAEHAAEIALAGGRPRLSTGAGLVGGGIFRQAVTPADPFDVLRSGKKLTQAEAKSLLDHYETLSAADRDAVVRTHHKVGVIDSGLTRLLAAVGLAELKARRALVSDIQERVQRIAVEQTSGKTLEELGTAQGAFMEASARKRALDKATEEAKKIGGPVPTIVTVGEVAAEHEKETKRTSPIKATVTNAWDALAAIPGEQDKWNARAAAVISKVVDACTKRAPELGIAAANLKWAPREVAERGTNVFAFSGDPISFGMRFVETAEANADYVVRTVVHEIAGHPEFGSRFKSYEAQIYAEAHKQKPDLGMPWDTKEEKSTFAYIGTEIYAALREVPYYTPVSSAHAGKGLITGIEPRENIDNKIGLVKSKYAPGIAEAVLQGLYERFRIDPRISPAALALFEEVAQKHFPGKLKGVPNRGAKIGFEPALGLGLEEAGGRRFRYTTFEANVVARWTDTVLAGGLRLDLAAGDKDTFVRLSLQSALRRRLFQSLYGELRAGYAVGLSGGATTGLTVGAGLSYDFGPVQAGFMYDYLSATDVRDPNAHSGFLRIGLRF